MSLGVTPAKWSGTMWKIAGRFTLPSVRAAAPSNGMSKPRFSWIFCMMLIVFIVLLFLCLHKKARKVTKKNQDIQIYLYLNIFLIKNATYIFQKNKVTTYKY
jgi:hypothetical protein